MTRKYELNKRAEKLEATRRRIVEATVSLHEEVGPARTSISAIAERAGVERLTVYRHFPGEQDMFHACAFRYRELHPLPDPERWLALKEPGARLKQALADMYAYYEEAAPMLSKVFGDLPHVPSMRKAVESAAERRNALVDVVVSGWDDSDYADRRRLSLAVRLAFDFNTWVNLVQTQGCSLEEAVELMSSLAACAAAD